MTGLFNGLFDSALTSVISPMDFLLCVGVSLVLGILLCVMMQYHSQFSKNLSITIAILPAVVCVVIMMVNGNVGTGVAVAGAFNLVRFRSAPGNAKEISALFIAMGAGLITGMGYLMYGVVFVVVLGLAMMVFNRVGYLLNSNACSECTLVIMIPEDLDYLDVFEPILKRYTIHHELIHVKTSNMGSLYKLTYTVSLKNTTEQKTFMDQLRIRNGNLEVSLMHGQSELTTL